MKGTSLTGRGRKMCLADENTTVCFGWGLFTNEHIRGYFSSHFGPIPILRLECKEYLNTRVEVVPRRLLCMSTFLVERFEIHFTYLSYALYTNTIVLFIRQKKISRCPRKRQDRGRRPRSKNYARRKSGLA